MVVRVHLSPDLMVVNGLASGGSRGDSQELRVLVCESERERERA